MARKKSLKQQQFTDDDLARAVRQIADFIDYIAPQFVAWFEALDSELMKAGAKAWKPYTKKKPRKQKAREASDSDQIRFGRH